MCIRDRRHRTQHVLTHGLFGHIVDKAAHHRQGNVGLEQRDTHLAHRVANVLLLERATALQPVKYRAKAIGQCVEHQTLPLGAHHAKSADGRNLADQRANQSPEGQKSIKRKTPADETSSASVNAFFFRLVAVSYTHLDVYKRQA